MTWEYLYDFQDREKIIASLLNVCGKHIVDLNCMHSPLLRYINQDFESYTGNDIQNVFPITDDKRVTFCRITDEDMVKVINKCDILIVMGHGGYEITKEPQESKTLKESINRIIKKTRPETVVLEGIQEFDELLHIDYPMTKEIYLNLGDSRVMKRLIRFFEL